MNTKTTQTRSVSLSPAPSRKCPLPVWLLAFVLTSSLLSIPRESHADEPIYFSTPDPQDEDTIAEEYYDLDDDCLWWEIFLDPDRYDSKRMLPGEVG